MIILAISRYTSLNKINITVNVGDGNLITNITLWSNKDYKKLSNLGNLNSYHSNGQTVSFDIELNDFNLIIDNNLVFIEVENDDNESEISSIYELDDIRKCSLNKLMESLSKDECINEVKKEIANIENLISVFQYSIKFNYFDKSIFIYESLQKMCKQECDTCPKFKYLN